MVNTHPSTVLQAASMGKEIKYYTPKKFAASNLFIHHQQSATLHQPRELNNFCHIKTLAVN